MTYLLPMLCEKESCDIVDWIPPKCIGANLISTVINALDHLAARSSKNERTLHAYDTQKNITQAIALAPPHLRTLHCDATRRDVREVQVEPISVVAIARQQHHLRTHGGMRFDVKPEEVSQIMQDVNISVD